MLGGIVDPPLSTCFCEYSLVTNGRLQFIVSSVKVYWKLKQCEAPRDHNSYFTCLRASWHHLEEHV